MPRLSRKDEARPGRRPSEGQYLSMPQLQGGHHGRGLVREWFLLPVAHVQAEIKKSFIERAPLTLTRAVPIQQLRPFKSFGYSRFGASNAPKCIWLLLTLRRRTAVQVSATPKQSPRSEVISPSARSAATPFADRPPRFGNANVSAWKNRTNKPQR